MLPNKSFPPIVELIDKWIEEHYKSITCEDIANTYWEFEETLKRYRSTCADFTGLSELLIFRILLHYLNEGLGAKLNTKYINKEKVYMEGDLIPFIDEGKKLKIGQTLKIKLENARYKKPDISLFSNEKLYGVVQIKTYKVSPAAFKNEFDGLEVIKRIFPSMKALFVLYSGKIDDEYKKVMGKNQWCSIILERNKSKFIDELERALSLKQYVKSEE